jgi:AAA15 family ATPase/GTPase
VVYGANAAGKSNLAKALFLAQQVIPRHEDRSGASALAIPVVFGL